MAPQKTKAPSVDWEIMDDMSKLMFLIYDYADAWNLQNKSIGILDTFVNEHKDLVSSDTTVSLLTGLQQKYPRGELLQYYSNSAGAQCFVGTNPRKKRLCIVFRGTDSFTDCLYDLFVIKKHLGNGIKVHRGFLNQLKSSQLYDKLLAVVREQSEAHPDWSVCITGHSLGAALATLCSYLLAKELPHVQYNVYAFASPKVGNKRFKEEYNAMPTLYNCRICYNKDCVVAFPTFWYAHVGVNLWYEKRTDTWHFYDTTINHSFYLCDYYNPFDHLSSNYMEAIHTAYESVCQNDGTCPNLITYC
jgi:predicted lipase